MNDWKPQLFLSRKLSKFTTCSVITELPHHLLLRQQSFTAPIPSLQNANKHLLLLLSTPFVSWILTL